ncbi:MAG: 4Fe-4S binding protein [Synergistaceae bacterium]|nr:4Fe-4S binding protein [Synergistaceae bacterium]
MNTVMKWQISAQAVGFGFKSASVAVFLVSAFLVGRAFCSFLCPMGTLQEFLWRLSVRLGIAQKKYIRPMNIRGAAALLAAAGILLSLPMLFIIPDPISNFGRGISSVLHMARGDLSTVGFVSAALFVVIAVFSLFRGRRFCDWCPVGAVLGFAANCAPFGMKLDDRRCVSCGMCEQSCPVNCVDAARKKIDRDRCVLCMGCAASCPGDFINFGVFPVAAENIPGRRNFIKYAAAFIIGAGYFGGRNLSELADNAAESETPPAASDDIYGVILPPGAVSAAHYYSRCIGCQACVSSCPVGIIKSLGIRPQIVYEENYCQYSCTECGKSCPTGAIRPLSAEDKRRTRIAVSELILPRCVVVTKRQACGACAEVCPTRALRMVAYESSASGLTIPVFEEEFCIGCGACFCVCPAEPRAFVMNSVPIHTLTPGIRPTTDVDEEAPSVRPMTKDSDFPFPF